MIDVSQQISSVRREVGARALEAGEARVVTIARTYATDLDDVWDACTNAERIPRWFLPITGELRLGGHYQLEGNAGGTIERCDPPKGFAATWEIGGAVSWIELKLSATPEGTLFQLDHIAPVSEHWEKYGPAATGVGWDMMIMGLTLHLDGGAAVDPAEAMAWQTSGEGKDFVAQSSEQWYQADVASGEDKALARKRADNTFAFYTGAPEA
ncbi:SRPBCC family protein [Amycolatopsis sp. NPDC059027]|uniref:SRPBCC family protein n=1 Tax=unclassified Amycolatopsis TaxID=2618356 RepID=UPI00366FA3A7